MLVIRGFGCENVRRATTSKNHWLTREKKNSLRSMERSCKGSRLLHQQSECAFFARIDRKGSRNLLADGHALERILCSNRPISMLFNSFSEHESCMGHPVKRVFWCLTIECRRKMNARCCYCGNHNFHEPRRENIISLFSELQGVMLLIFPTQLTDY